MQYFILSTGNVRCSQMNFVLLHFQTCTLYILYILPPTSSLLLPASLPYAIFIFFFLVLVLFKGPPEFSQDSLEWPQVWNWPQEPGVLTSCFTQLDAMPSFSWNLLFSRWCRECDMTPWVPDSPPLSVGRALIDHCHNKRALWVHSSSGNISFGRQ